jgi:APA family basic amino acid/polyamine antiporter
MSDEPTNPHPGALRSDAALIRAVGFWGLAAAVVNVIVGGGIFKFPAALDGTVGAAAPLALVLGALAILPVALCFSAAGSRVTATGGPYTYAEAAFGPFTGFLAGVLMWICNVASSAGVATALADTAGGAYAWFKEPVPRALFLTVVYGLLIGLNARGIKVGNRAIAALATAKLLPLIILAIAGLFLLQGGTAPDWSHVPSWGAFGTSMVLVIFAYSGMETALIPTGEVKDPSRQVPRATMLAVAFVIALYVGVQVVSMRALGGGLAGSATPLADVAGHMWKPGFALLLATAAVSMLGFLQGNVLASSRLVYALARDGFLPPLLAKVGERYRVPLGAIFIHGGVAWILSIGGNFAALALVSGGANCLVYVICSLAAGRLQQRGIAEHREPLVLPGGWTVPVLAVAAMCAILATLTPKEWGAISIALVAVMVIYAATRLVRRRESG